MHETPANIEEAPNYAQHALSWESSELTQAEYCKRHGLVLARLVCARSKLLGSRGRQRRAPQTSKFLPVRAKPGAQAIENSDSASIVIRFSRGTVVTLPSDLEEKSLSAIFKTLT